MITISLFRFYFYFYFLLRDADATHNSTTMCCMGKNNKIQGGEEKGAADLTAGGGQGVDSSLGGTGGGTLATATGFGI